MWINCKKTKLTIMAFTWKRSFTQIFNSFNISKENMITLKSFKGKIVTKLWNSWMIIFQTLQRKQLEFALTLMRQNLRTTKVCFIQKLLQTCGNGTNYKYQK